MANHTPWPFSVMCAQGHYADQGGLTANDLRKLLRAGSPIPLYCIECDRSWTASEEERGKIQWALGQTGGAKA